MHFRIHGHARLEIFMQNKKIKFIKNNKRKGFSLIETIVAVFVFSLVVVALTGTFAGFLRSYLIEKKNHRVLENAQYTLMLMEKTIRTSVVSTSSGTADLAFDGADAHMIKLYDNSQAKCVSYIYSDKRIKMAVKPGNDEDISTCGDFKTGYDISDITSDYVEYMKVSGKISEAGKAGKVSIAIGVKEASQAKAMNIGTTVSLRYSEPEAPFVCLNRPDNAQICSGDDTGLVANTESTLVTSVSSCTTAKKCEFSCSAGFVKSGSSCIAETFSCTGTIPANSQICANDNMGLTANTAISLVDTCSSPVGSAPKCQYTCTAGYNRSGSSCVAVTYNWVKISTGGFTGEECFATNQELSGSCSPLGATQVGKSCYYDGMNDFCPEWVCNRPATYRCQ